MMNLHPDHLTGIAKRLPPENQIFPFNGDDHTHLFQLRCLCGREDFQVWRSNMPSVYALCPDCHAPLIVYDLRLYPAATHIERADPFALVTFVMRVR